MSGTFVALPKKTEVLLCQACGSIIQPITDTCINCDSPVDPTQIPSESEDDEESILGAVFKPKNHPDVVIGSLYTRIINFQFSRFAQAIYRDRSAAHSEHFLLPALYGGELERNEPYDALVVLQDPGPDTEALWTRCGTVDEGIKQHRQIFLTWAYRKNTNQAILFEECSSAPDQLFRHCYVTDIWKDRKCHSTEDRKYWFTKLRIELCEVRAQHIIFAGDVRWTPKVGQNLAGA